MGVLSGHRGGSPPDCGGSFIAPHGWRVATRAMSPLCWMPGDIACRGQSGELLTANSALHWLASIFCSSSLVTRAVSARRSCRYQAACHHRTYGLTKRGLNVCKEVHQLSLHTHRRTRLWTESSASPRIEGGPSIAFGEPRQDMRMTHPTKETGWRHEHSTPT